VPAGQEWHLVGWGGNFGNETDQDLVALFTLWKDMTFTTLIAKPMVMLIPKGQQTAKMNDASGLVLSAGNVAWIDVFGQDLLVGVAPVGDVQQTVFYTGRRVTF